MPLNSQYARWLKRRVLEWYAAEGKPWPWRTNPPNPYVILVSEFMLQQTQAARVATKLPEFLNVFPTLTELARANPADVLQAWTGMGYNMRAIRLHKTAQIIVQEHNGRVPDLPAVLQELPGIGSYASNSLVSFIYNLPVVVLDVNVRRVYSRVGANLPVPEKKNTLREILPDNLLKQIGHQLVPINNSAKWHHAVMDLGATICTARNPGCTLCPLSQKCPSANNVQWTKPIKRSEPSFNGTPNRLWRGKMVEALRSAPERGIRKQDLYYNVVATQPPSKPQELWLEQILAALEADGLIHVRGDILQLFGR